MVWDYLEIKQARPEHRVSLSLQIPRELWGYEVPPFSLQSLIQNRIQSVPETRPEGLETRVAGRLVNGQLALSVWDNGPKRGRAAVPGGRGIDALHARLATLYNNGDEARLEVHREESGTQITMSVPPSARQGRPT